MGHGIGQFQRRAMGWGDGVGETEIRVGVASRIAAPGHDQETGTTIGIEERRARHEKLFLDREHHLESARCFIEQQGLFVDRQLPISVLYGGCTA